MAQATQSTLPPRVVPAKKPLRFPANIFKMLSNNLEIVPEQAYEEEVVLAPGPPRMAFITGPEAIEALLMKRVTAFPKGRLQNEVLEPLMGDAMISSEGAEWKWQRGAAAPLFRHAELMRYVPVMNASAEATIADWRKTPQGTTRAINRDMLHAAFRVISETMLAGGAPEVLKSIENGHGEYFRHVNWWIAYRMLGLPHWLPRPGGKAMRERENWLHEEVRKLVHQRSATAADSDDLLARFLVSKDPESGQSMPEQRLVGNVIAFLVAGFDTTALAMTWALFLISQHPEWAQRMRNEVSRVAGDEPISQDHLRQLVVVEQVLNEALRLYPTAPLIVREIPEDTELGGVHIPAGTMGLIPIYTIHRHRKLWENPDSFDPTRFSPETGSKPGRYQFLPFGAGPRICIGAAFAMIEAKVMLASFVRAADFELEPGFVPHPTGQMFLTAAGDIPVRVTMRP